MKTLVAILLLAILAIIVIAGVVAAVRKWRGQRSFLSAKWRVCVDSVSSLGQVNIVVQLRRRGSYPIRVAVLKPTAEDFDAKLHEAKAEADVKAAALNSNPRSKEV